MGGLRAHVQIGRLAVKVVFLNDVHVVIVAASKDAHVVRVALAVLVGPVRWHLQVKSVENATGVVGAL